MSKTGVGEGFAHPLRLPEELVYHDHDHDHAPIAPPEHEPTPDHFGRNRPKRPQPSSEDLASRLDALAGGKLQDLVPSEGFIIERNQLFANATHQRFEHRALLGIAINNLRPEHGEIGDYNKRIADRIGRSPRWVQDTANVAQAISTAIDEGVSLPLDLREVYWRKVPGAVENIRQGPPIDFVPKKAKVEPTPEQKAQAVEKAIQTLTEALDAIDSTSQRQALTTKALEALEPYLLPH
jgi:hypothetical protein